MQGVALVEAPILLRKGAKSLEPADESAFAFLRSLKLGEVYRVEVKRPRNLTEHRRYWALCTFVWTNTEQFGSADEVHEYLKLRGGHCKLIVSDVTGEIFKIAKSISFREMTAGKWNEFWVRCKDVVRMDFIPTMSDADLEFELSKLIQDAWGRR